MNKDDLGFDLSAIDVSEEKLGKVKDVIRQLPERDIKDIVMRMDRVVSAHNQRAALLRNTKLLVKILAITAAVV